MATPIDLDAMYPDLTIWLRHRNMDMQNPVRPRPNAELTEDGFFSDELMAPPAPPLPPISTSYDFLNKDHTDLGLGPSAQDAFEMQLDEYFDRNIPATAVRHASELQRMLTVHDWQQRALPPLPSARVPASRPNAPPSPPRDADFAFYRDQRDFLFLKDRRAGRYASEPALVRSRFGPSVPTVDGGLVGRGTSHGGSALASPRAKKSGGKKSGGKSRKAALFEESSTKTRRRQADPSVVA